MEDGVDPNVIPKMINEGKYPSNIDVRDIERLPSLQTKEGLAEFFLKTGRVTLHAEQQFFSVKDFGKKPVTVRFSYS